MAVGEGIFMLGNDQLCTLLVIYSLSHG
jgi:hypothetical protein